MNKLLSCNCAAKWGPFALLVLRVVAGVIFAYHGYLKLSGGVDGFGGLLDGLGVPLPLFFAWVVTLVELVGGILLILGLLTHLFSKLLAIDMLVAVLLVHAKNGLLVQNGGAEFALLLLAVMIALMTLGAGPWSLDASLMKKSVSKL